MSRAPGGPGDESGRATPATVRIHATRSGDRELIRRVRLRALADAPYAFSSRLDDVASRPDAYWQRIVEDNAKGEASTSCVAMAGEHPVGMAAGVIDDRDRSVRHLVGMWVAPEARGSGVAWRLVDFVADWARRSGARLLVAGVTRTNARALSFYRKCGFGDAPRGRRRPAFLDGCEHLLELDLGASAPRWRSREDATVARLERRLARRGRSPRDDGPVEMIVRRPAIGQREVLERAELDPEAGLVGDDWVVRGSSRTPGGGPHPEMQLTLMNSRVVDLLAGGRERWALAGDQLYVDLDLAPDGLPPGSRLAVGSAEIEITAMPHTGCRKFAERFGIAALRLVNSPRGRAQGMRGVNARVVRQGTVRVGDRVRRLSSSPRPGRATTGDLPQDG